MRNPWAFRSQLTEATIHLFAAVHMGHGALTTVVVIIMAALCIPCAFSLWSRANLGALRMVEVSSAAMAVIGSRCSAPPCSISAAAAPHQA